MNNERLEAWDRFGVWIFTGSLIATVYMSSTATNMVGAIKFFVLFASIGCVISMIPVAIIQRLPSYIKSKKRGKRLGMLAYIIDFALLSASIGALVNRQFASDETFQKRVRVDSKGATRKFPIEYLLYVELEGDRKQLSVSRSYWDNVEAGDFIEISMRKGFFGYPIIEM